MLAEYARFPLFTTVGIDSSFYGPPHPTSLANWARVLPAGFRCVSKVWDRITVHTFAGKREPTELAGQRNPDFLNPNLFLTDVLEPYRRNFGDHTGPFVFEFQTIAGWGPRAAGRIHRAARRLLFAAARGNRATPSSCGTRSSSPRPTSRCSGSTTWPTCSARGPGCRRWARSSTWKGRSRRTSWCRGRCSARAGSMRTR